MSPYLRDNNITLLQRLNPNMTVKRNVSVQESLYLLLEASYRFKLIDPYQIFNLDISSSNVVFLLANYLPFKSTFKSLNKDML